MQKSCKMIQHYIFQKACFRSKQNKFVIKEHGKVQNSFLLKKLVELYLKERFLLSTDVIKKISSKQYNNDFFMTKTHSLMLHFSDTPNHKLFKNIQKTSD